MRAAIFLDRDGILNRAIVKNGKPYPPLTFEELEIIPGAFDLLVKLKEAGYLLLAITNQPDVARGLVSKAWVEKVNAYIGSKLPIDFFKVCYHDDSDGCRCRKPLPGSLIDASRDLNIDLSKSFMIGDRWRDISAGHAAGCKTIFVDYGYSEKRPISPDYVVTQLSQIDSLILGGVYEKS